MNRYMPVGGPWEVALLIRKKQFHTPTYYYERDILKSDSLPRRGAPRNQVRRPGESASVTHIEEESLKHARIRLHVGGVELG